MVKSRSIAKIRWFLTPNSFCQEEFVGATTSQKPFDRWIGFSSLTWCRRTLRARGVCGLAFVAVFSIRKSVRTLTFWSSFQLLMIFVDFLWLRLVLYICLYSFWGCWQTVGLLHFWAFGSTFKVYWLGYQYMPVFTSIYVIQCYTA